MKLRKDKLGAVLAPNNIGDPLDLWEVREALLTAARRIATAFNKLPDDGSRFEHVRKRFDAADWVVTIWPIRNEAGECGYRFRPIFLRVIGRTQPAPLYEAHRPVAPAPAPDPWPPAAASPADGSLADA